MGAPRPPRPTLNHMPPCQPGFRQN
jgi:hypothetical protein